MNASEWCLTVDIAPSLTSMINLLHFVLEHQEIWLLFWRINVYVSDSSAINNFSRWQSAIFAIAVGLFDGLAWMRCCRDHWLQVSAFLKQCEWIVFPSLSKRSLKKYWTPEIVSCMHNLWFEIIGSMVKNCLCICCAAWNSVKVLVYETRLMFWLSQIWHATGAQQL